MKWLLPMLIFFLLMSCNGQNSNSQDQDKVYPSTGHRLPFQFSKAEKSVRVPDSLRLNGFYTGTMAVNFFVDSTGKLEGLCLRLLRIQNEQKEKLIWYYNESMRPILREKYPPEIEPYLDWVFEYSKKRKIVKLDSIPNKFDKWMLTIKVNLE